jgi:hypothetical protein
MKQQEQPKDWLEARLREETPYIDDGGFTARVVQKLPAPRPRRSFRGAILLCATILACLLAYFVSDGGRFLAVEVYRLLSMPVLFVSLVALVLALTTTAVAAGAAWSNTRTQR